MKIIGSAKFLSIILTDISHELNGGMDVSGDLNLHYFALSKFWIIFQVILLPILLWENLKTETSDWQY
jgi:hypothetical protein